MTIEPRTITHERFKELVREWLDTHTEEYYAFATEMNRRDRSGFQQIFQYAVTLVPSYAKAVMTRMTDSGSEDFSSLEKVLEDADIASKIVNDFQLQYPGSITPPLLAWLYFGNSWETIVAYNEEMIQDKSNGMMSRLMARLIIKFTIRQSIKIEHRTKEDWNNFRKTQKEMGSMMPITDATFHEMDNDDVELSASEENKEPQKRGRRKIRTSLDSLLTKDVEQTKARITDYLIKYPGGNHLATLYICLTRKEHMCHCELTTFYNALKEHMPDYNFVKIRTLQSAHQLLTTPMGGGKCIIDSGKDLKHLNVAIEHFAA